MAKYHVHAIHWNESRLTPIFLKHYASADRIFIYDNESDPSVLEPLRKAGAEIIPFSTGQTFNDLVHQEIKNSGWKASRGSADYVIVQDFDELVHFPWMAGDIKGALDVYKDLGLTFAQSRCLNVVSSDEEWDEVLSSIENPWTLFQRGIRGNALTQVTYDKIQVFSPDQIRESKYDPGAHHWDAEGVLVQAPAGFEPFMMHCKHIGRRCELERRLAYGRRTSEANRKNGLSLLYQKDEAFTTAVVEGVYRDPRVEDLAKYMDHRSKQMFTRDWTKNLSATLDLHLPTAGEGPVRILEIGSFEGRGTLMFFNRFCRHPDSVVHCVDPWDDLYARNRPEFKLMDPLFVGQYARFVFNTRHERVKIRVFRGTSNEILPTLSEPYDLIYIDGDHHPDQAYQDALMAFPLTKPGGMIILDDYVWEFNGVGPKEGMDRFVKEFGHSLEVLPTEGPQLALRRSMAR